MSNSILMQHERLVNARYIYKYLKDKGWKDNAIFAMLGNMEAESYINPGVWYNLDSDAKIAYGLTQWNAPSKLTNWLASNKKSDNIENQLGRILYEVENDKEQWQKNKHTPKMTFAAFTTSSKSRDVLTEYFLKCYEAPGNEDTLLPIRQVNAKKWATLIGYLV